MPAYHAPVVPVESRGVPACVRLVAVFLAFLPAACVTAPSRPAIPVVREAAPEPIPEGIKPLTVDQEEGLGG